MPANNIYIQVDLNASSAQANINALNNALALTGPASQKSAQQTTTALNSVNISVSQTTKAFEELTGALAGLGLERMAQNIIQVGSEWGRSVQMIARFTSSAQEAKRAIEEFRAVGKESLFPQQQTVAAGERLLAAGMGIDKAKASLKAFNDLAAATGGSIEDVTGNVNIYVRMMNKELATAMDLMRKLPAAGVPIGPIIKKALGTDDVEEAVKILKNNAADYSKLIDDINEGIEKKFGGAAASINDLEKQWKDLGDEVKATYEKIVSDQGFGKQLKDLTAVVGGLLEIFRELLDLLMALPDPIKEIIVFVGAFAVATLALGSAWQILGSVLKPGIALLGSMSSVIGPAIEGVWALTRALTAGLIAALTNPYVLVAIGAVTALTVGFATFFPEQFKKLENQATTWVENMWTTVKDKAQGLASGAVKATGLFPAEAAAAGAGAGTGNALQETSDNLKVVQQQVDKWSEASGRSLLQALGAPADAVEAKYKELFAQLDELIKTRAISQTHADEQREELRKAQAIETQTDILKVEEKQTADAYKRETELAKTAYDAQILYEEAKDEQGLRNKAAAIDRITQLRIDSVQTVARIENEGIEEAYQKQRKVLIDNQEFLKAHGFDVEAALTQLRDESQKKEDYNTRKANEEEWKYKLEGTKKVNNLIIEDQKRVYEAFQSMFDDIFDAFTNKTKSIGQALGDVFKKLALGEVRNFFSSQMAGAATEMAGYGQPEPGIRRSGGILGVLLQRGMPPRPMMEQPEGYNPATAQSGIKSFGDIVGGTGTGGANRTISEAAGVYNVSAIVFANAVNRFSAATVSHQGSADRMMESSSEISEASDAIQQASAATGVPTSILTAVGRTESNLNAAAVGRMTRYGQAQGMFQLMPSTQQQWGITNPFDPYQSAMGGAQQLNWLYGKYGNWPATLAAYNYGPTNYDRAMAAGRPLPTETQNYVAKILRSIGGGDGAAAAPFARATRPFALPPGFSMEGGQLSYATPGAGGADVFSGDETARYLRATGGGGGAVAPAVTFDQLVNLPIRQPSYDMGALTTIATPTEVAEAKQASALTQVVGTLAKGSGMSPTGILQGLAKSGGLAGLASFFGIGTARGATPGGESMARVAASEGGPTLAGLLGSTSLKSVLTSRGAGMLASMGGMALLSKGLQQRNAPATAIGGGLAGVGTALMSPQLMARFASQTGGVGLGLGAAAATGVGLGIFASGFQRGGGAGVAMDIGGGALAGAGIGTMILPGLGTAIGAAVGAAAGAITGVVRLFVHTEQERIRSTIKQVYGLDISNRSVLTQIQQIVDQKYGGSVSIGVRSQEAQDIIRLYALSTGQAANLPRPMYAATVAQSTQGLQLQPVYQGGVSVANPYSGPTTYQYQNAVATAMGLKPGTSQGVPGASGIIGQQWQQLTMQTIQGNPSAIAMANAAAATAGDSRLTTTQAMQEPLTALS